MILLAGKPVKEKILKSVERIGKEALQRIHLHIIASNTLENTAYIESKKKACEKLGINVRVSFIEPTLDQLKATVNDLNYTTGIIVQFPFGNLETKQIANCIPAYQDVDGITPTQIGNLILRKPHVPPATAIGIIELLKYYKIQLEGKHCVIINRSHIVGLPLQQLLLQQNCTTTICHSYTTNLKEICKQADIIIVGVGQPNFIDSSFIGNKKPVIIDVGINRVNGKLVGDVNFDEVAPLCEAITPVPGGVGQLTVACVIRNLVQIYKNFLSLSFMY